VDVDGGGFQSPRDYAEALVRKGGFAELGRYDASVALQVTLLTAK
jgi:hypothetical protein